MSGGYASMDGDVQFYGSDSRLSPIPGGLARKYLSTLEANGKYVHQVNPVNGAKDTNEVIREKALRVAAEMHARGIGHHDVIVICSRVHSDQTVGMLATLLVGATVGPIDPDWNIALLKNFIHKLKPKMIFCDMRVLGYLEQALKDAQEAIHCQFVIFSDHDHRSIKKFYAKRPNTDFKPVEVRDPKSAVAFILPSQGTTMSPKLISMSHYAIHVQTCYVRYNCMPTSEVVATFSNLATAVQVVISCVCLEFPVTKLLMDCFVERSVCKAIEDHNVDTIWLGYGNAKRLANHESFRDYNFQRLQSLFIIGSAVSANAMANMRKIFSQVAVFECYTLTEMCFLVTCYNVNSYRNALAKPNSCGPLLDEIRCKVVDLDSNKSVGPNKWGELYLRGPSVMVGYFRDLDGTRSIFENNWLRTGDGGQFDEDANLYVCGRISDLLNVKGKWLPPMDIEEIISMHPGVDEVTVIGLKDFLIACVVKKPEKEVTERALLDFIAEKLPANRRPQQVKFLPNLPKTHTGNVRRNELRQQYLHIRIERVESIQESRSGTFPMNRTR